MVHNICKSNGDEPSMLRFLWLHAVLFQVFSSLPSHSLPLYLLI